MGVVAVRVEAVEGKVEGAMAWAVVVRMAVAKVEVVRVKVEVSSVQTMRVEAEGG